MKTLWYSTLLFCSNLLHAQCSDIQQFNASQQQQLGNTFIALQQALYDKDLSAIDSISASGKSIMGNEAGQPESSITYVTVTSNTTWLSTTNALLLSRMLIDSDSSVYAQIWKVCKGMAPPQYAPNSVILRSGAEICIGLLRISAAETDLNRKNLYYNWAKRGLDSLLTMQLSYGAYPFPDLRPYNDPVFTPIINNYLQSLGADSVNVLQNGWIINDRGTGQFKFDAGVIGGVFAEAYVFTGDTLYRNAAIRSANYLDTLRYNTNYNYNTFQAYGSAFGYSLAPTITRPLVVDSIFRFSVYPGQIANGKWMDGHNAKPVYHGIIIHNTSTALHNCTVTTPYRDTSIVMLNKALRAALNLFYSCGASHGFDSWLRAWKCDTAIVPQPLKDSIADVIGMHINQAAINGRFLDVYTMGLYLEAQLNLTNINDVQQPHTPKVFPNPGNNYFTIERPTSGNSVITIYNVAGTLMHTVNLSAASFTMNTSTWSPGVYIVKVQSGQTTLYQKWVKQ